MNDTVVECVSCVCMFGLVAFVAWLALGGRS